jgi:ferredoxin
MTEIDLESFDFTDFLKDIRIFIDKDICNGCGICGEVCPFGLPQVTCSDKFEIDRPDLCTECSACKRNCPSQAIVLKERKLKERKGCGCLWNARGLAKNAKKGKPNGGNMSCGSAEQIDSTTSCCG